MRTNAGRLRLLFCCLAAFLLADILQEGCIGPRPVAPAITDDEAAAPAPFLSITPHRHPPAVDDLPGRMILRSHKR